MAGLKFLVDTNVFIALEDPKIVSSSAAELAQKAQLHSVALFLDEATFDDVSRDNDPVRRAITLSKLRKFPALQDVVHRRHDELEQRFGAIRNDNDRCDVLMLDTLDLNVVDFLITEDIEIHKRAARASLHRRVFTVREALLWLQRTFEPQEFRLPFIEARKAHQLDVRDTLFDSLREDYRDFDTWFAKCRREHRDCWSVEIDGQLAGVVIWKAENRVEAKPLSDGDRVLKVCTFKMKEEYQGEKFGEQLLKKILWFAQTNHYDVVYLTVFPKHQFLVELISAFGFRHTRTERTGEYFMERSMTLDDAQFVAERSTVLQADFGAYPRFYDGPNVDKYIVPIRPEFHAVLFPEIAEFEPLPLFPDEHLLRARWYNDRTPGNTIRKVYVCRSPTRSLQSGDVLVFYLSKSDQYTRSQSATTIGVVERVSLANDGDQLIRFVGRRSVFSQETLQALAPSEKSPVLVIDFLLNGHLDPAVSLEDLLSIGAFANRPSQSIKRLDESAYRQIRSIVRLSFE